ncbi:MAG: helicase C-terminal domain-containing protein [Candidatus Heimdallarchaeaceae archaeon]|jgi:DNA excision repair protein ERCC-2
MNNKTNGEMTDKTAFCPSCGKILVAEQDYLKCNKCGEQLDNEIRTKDSTFDSWQDFFPYIEVRPLQQEIIQTIETDIRKRAHFIIQAANGVGKTIAILSSLLPFCKAKKKMIVYSCRTHQQMSRVISEMKMIKQLSPVKGIALRGRKELCLHPILQKFAVDSGNASEICRYLKEAGRCKYFNKLADKKAIQKISRMTKKEVMDSQELIDIGKSLEVCPFEISYKLLSDSDVVACSYQYVFNPHIQTTFFNSLEKDLSDIILVIDEAHNLPSTAIDISSATLSNFTLESAEKEATRQRMGAAYDLLEALSHVLIQVSRGLTINEEQKFKPDDYIRAVEKRAQLTLDEEMVKELYRLGEHVKKEQIQRSKAPFSYTSAVVRFLSLLIETRTKNDYAHFVTKVESKGGNPIPKLLILSLDPRTITKKIFDEVYLSISASGTLEPIDAYTALVGLKEKRVVSIDLPSPYKIENHLTLVVDKLSSKLENRIPATYEQMLEVIESVVNATPKNIGVFCASYTVMNDLLKIGLENRLSKPLFIAHQGMNSMDNDELIKDFKKEAKKSGGVLISVLGGRSSEGSDYPAGEMQSVVIVGIPYAKPSPTIDATIEYLDSQFPNKGREYGYNIPALTRASQAAGRPIRSLDDYAVIILLDFRFARSYYKRHLPIWLKQNMILIQPDKEEILEKTNSFFNFHK